MNLASAFSNTPWEQLRRALDGGTLVIYSVARPTNPDYKVQRSGVLATFTFASPGFAAEKPLFVANPVVASGTGTPGFARAFAADGLAVADFSAGPGNAEIKLNEVSCTSGFPITFLELKPTLASESSPTLEDVAAS
jgi:hypothetical protein